MAGSARPQPRDMPAEEFIDAPVDKLGGLLIDGVPLRLRLTHGEPIAVVLPIGLYQRMVGKLQAVEDVASERF